MKTWVCFPMGMLLHLLLTVLLFVGNGSQAAVIELNGHAFTLHDGFEIELVAGPPLVNRPICADFDEQGFLYVADSGGSNDDVQTQRETRPHRIVRLQDSDGDGRYDKSVVYADRMMFPEGTMWYDGSLYVAAPPIIWKLTDIDADGVADLREPWFDGKTLTACANDLHGPYLGPDGWIYWCKGAFAEQTYERPGKAPLITRAAHIFRRRPQGGIIEPVMIGGMDNPVEVVFTPGGERIFTTTFLQRPANGLRDGLIHAIYGGVYGKDHGVLEGHPRTGPIMPVLDHLGAAAPCGLVCLQTDQLGPQFRHNLLACLFNMRKVTRHVLIPTGATFRSDREDFLLSNNLDFHPTDVLEDADGSVLVVNTGGWYKLCCPTSQLWKPDILGAIYRVRQTKSHQVIDPRGKEIAWSALTSNQLTELLADPRFVVRNRARQALGLGGEEAIESLSNVLLSSHDPQPRLHAVWALARIDDPRARVVARRALQDADESVRQAALHSISIWRDRQAEGELLHVLQSGTAQNRRAAAEALGRLGSSGVASALLAATANETDRFLEHSLIYAMLELDNDNIDQTRWALQHDSPRVRRAALIALDQSPKGDLKATEVLPQLDSPEPILRDTAWWIVERRPEWAEGLAGYFRHAIANRPVDRPVDRDVQHRLSTRLAPFAKDAVIQEVMAAGLRNRSASRETQVAIISAMATTGLKEMPAAWSVPLYELLATDDTELLHTVVDAVHALSESALEDKIAARLTGIARDGRLPIDVRLKALLALPKTVRSLDSDLLRVICDHLAAEQPVSIRSLAVDVLVNTPLKNQQLQVVAQALVHVGSMELNRLMEAFAKSHDAQVGLKLIDCLLLCPTATSLSTDALRKQLSGYGEEVLEKAGTLFERIDRENEQMTQKLESILTLVKQGDVRQGQAIFHSAKAACAACHALGYLGGRAGPGLTQIGRIRSERDVLESILFPSASLVRSYESTMIVTVDGRVLTGIVRDETAEDITLQLDAEKVIQIANDQIEDRQPGSVSIMPAGLDKQLSDQQLADLVAFLMSTK